MKYQTKYEAGFEILSDTESDVASVLDQNSRKVFTGTNEECLKWLADHGDHKARSEYNASHGL